MLTKCTLVAALLAATVLAALPAAEDKKADPVPRDVTIKTIAGPKGPESIEFLVGDKLTTRYHIDPSVAKPYFWPLNSPSGVATVVDPISTGTSDPSLRLKCRSPPRTAPGCGGEVQRDGAQGEDPLDRFLSLHGRPHVDLGR